MPQRVAVGIITVAPNLWSLLVLKVWSQGAAAQWMEVKYWLLRQLQLKDTHTQTELQSGCYAARQATVMHFKDGLVLLTSQYRITLAKAWGGGYVCSIRHLSRDSFHASSDNRDGENKLCCHVSNSIWVPENIRSVLGFLQCFEKYVREKNANIK